MVHFLDKCSNEMSEEQWQEYRVVSGLKDLSAAEFDWLERLFEEFNA